MNNPGISSPLWYPPIETKWILTILVIFVGAVANRIPYNIVKNLSGPFGFFFISVVALGVFTIFPPGAFAILFLLLSVWAVATTKQQEGFLSASNIDWVTNSKRWYVEKVLHERPIGIQEKDEPTYPVQGASAQASTSSGTT